MRAWVKVEKQVRLLERKGIGRLFTDRSFRVTTRGWGWGIPIRKRRRCSLARLKFISPLKDTKTLKIDFIFQFVCDAERDLIAKKILAFCPKETKNSQIYTPQQDGKHPATFIWESFSVSCTQSMKKLND